MWWRSSFSFYGDDGGRRSVELRRPVMRVVPGFTHTDEKILVFKGVDVVENANCR